MDKSLNPAAIPTTGDGVHYAPGNALGKTERGWLAYTHGGVILRTINGVGRRFATAEAASRALDAHLAKMQRNNPRKDK